MWPKALDVSLMVTLDAAPGRCQSATCVVRSLFVVVDHPPMRRLADIVQASEQAQVKHPFPERATEALDVGVLLRLAGLDESSRLNGDAALSPYPSLIDSALPPALSMNHRISVRHPTHALRTWCSPC